MHKHTWTRSKRQHRRPPRFFVECACGARAQAVMIEGFLHTFQTNRKREGSNVIAFRVTDKQFETYNRDRAGFARKWKKDLE